jgi:hypothetical protein
MTPKAPLEAFGKRKPLEKLGVKAHAYGIRSNQNRARGKDVACSHQRRQKAEAAMQRELTSAISRTIQNVINYQSHVVSKLYGEDRRKQACGRRLSRNRTVTRKQRNGAEMLRAPADLSPNNLPYFRVALLRPLRDQLAKAFDVRGQAEPPR